MPSVAIIGAGPSGLSAAKAMVEQGLSPVVFDSASSIGGMWGEQGRGAWSDYARTNLSHYSCRFSDFPWPEGTDTFPLRSQLSDYLKGYAETFNLSSRIRLNTQVTAVSRPPEGSWVLDVEGPEGDGSHCFDHLVVATGVFTKPYIPELPGLGRFGGELLHSHDCFSEELNRKRFEGKRVLVIGAAFSGTEIASQLTPWAESVTVTLRRPMWFVPRYLSTEPGGEKFPTDLVFYSRSENHRMEFRSPEFLRQVAGDPGAVSDELAFDEDEGPLLLVTTDDFLDHVRSGNITPKRTSSLKFEEKGVVFSDGSFQEFDTVIACTGYRSALPFMDEDILKTLEFQAEDQLQPLLLHRQVFHPDLPGLAFIGYYRGPYLAVMELQSRWVARIIAGEIPAPSREEMLAGLGLEREIRNQSPRPQFPHGDFVSLADGVAKEAGVLPDVSALGPLGDFLQKGPLVPAHYRLTGPNANPQFAETIIRETPAPLLGDGKEAEMKHKLEMNAENESSVQVVFSLLEGTWEVERSITEKGQFRGKAHFKPLGEGSLHYKEEGTLLLASGMELAVKRHYLYRLQENRIEVNFSDEKGGMGEHFVFIDFDRGEKRWPIKSVEYTHLCIKDTYKAGFLFETKDRFDITFDVCGPQKDYVSSSEFRRIL